MQPWRPLAGSHITKRQLAHDLGCACCRRRLSSIHFASVPVKSPRIKPAVTIITPAFGASAAPAMAARIPVTAVTGCIATDPLERSTFQLLGRGAIAPHQVVAERRRKCSHTPLDAVEDLAQDRQTDTRITSGQELDGVSREREVEGAPISRDRGERATGPAEEADLAEGGPGLLHSDLVDPGVLLAHELHLAVQDDVKLVARISLAEESVPGIVVDELALPRDREALLLCETAEERDLGHHADDIGEKLRVIENIVVALVVHRSSSCTGHGSIQV